MYRMMAMDLDGTLLMSDGTIPEETVAALRLISSKGVHLVIASGRMTKTCEIYADMLGGASILSFNSAVIKKTDGTMIKHLLPEDVLKKAAEFCYRHNKLYIQMYDGTKICVKETCREFESDLDTRINEYEELGELSVANLKPSPKAVIVDYDPELITSIRKELEETFPELTITQSSAYVIEIMPKGIDKGYGLKMIAEDMGIDPKDVIAVGDSHNDIAMFDFAGTGVAVGNADPILKEKADVITEGKCSYGVLEAVKRLFPDYF